MFFLMESLRHDKDNSQGLERLIAQIERFRLLLNIENSSDSFFRYFIDFIYTNYKSVWYFSQLTKALQLEEEVFQIGNKRVLQITPQPTRKSTKLETPATNVTPATIFAAPRRPVLGRNLTASFSSSRTVHLPARKQSPRCDTPTTVVRSGAAEALKSITR